MNTTSITTSKTRDMVISALLISLVYISTRFINIRLPISINGGLVHLGTSMLYISAIVFGKNKAALAGALGMALFDITSDWVAWAPFTFVVRGIMGYVVGHIAYMSNSNGRNIFYNLLGIILGGACMLAGYYATEGILYGNWITPINSIPGNTLQIVFGAIIAIPLSATLKKTIRL